MKLYSQQNKQLQEVSIAEKINIYTCGPTVYDYPHIGNWYTFIRYDSLVRSLRSMGASVEWVMNITDVGHLVSDADDGEDKLEKGAKREGKTAWDVADYYTKYFVEGLKRLHFSEINHLPRATDYISEQIALIQQLEKKSFTYQIDDGVYFDTAKFSAYADFAQLNLQAQHEGARVEANSQKRNASDFALWKFSPTSEKRDMEWQSPWGVGFPGWHLECSAMIHALLPEPLTIHGGGIDHIPVHHTNEIAQSVCAFDSVLSQHWYHCNHILVDGKKMSKSLGNFYTLEDIEQKGFSLTVFRLHVLSGHYRSQSEFSWDTLSATKQRLQGWVDALIHQLYASNTEGETLPKSFKEAILTDLADDLNTPKALAKLDEVIAQSSPSSVHEIIEFIDTTFGLSLHEITKPLTKKQQEMIALRLTKRDEKDWQASDTIRGDLLKEGIVLRDSTTKTNWSRLV